VRRHLPVLCQPRSAAKHDDGWAIQTSSTTPATVLYKNVLYKKSE